MIAPFEKVEWVIEVIPGYTGGYKENPTYHEVCAGHTDTLSVLSDVKGVEIRFIQSTDKGISCWRVFCSDVGSALILKILFLFIEENIDRNKVHGVELTD